MTGPLNLSYVRASVSAWETGRRIGLADANNVNLAEYAAAILPELCDELETARAHLCPPALNGPDAALPDGHQWAILLEGERFNTLASCTDRRSAEVWVEFYRGLPGRNVDARIVQLDADGNVVELEEPAGTHPPTQTQEIS